MSQPEELVLEPRSEEFHAIPRKPLPKHSVRQSYHRVNHTTNPAMESMNRLEAFPLPASVEADTWVEDKETTAPNGKWPDEADYLGKWTRFKVTILICDCILTLSPVIFLLFGLCALALNGKPLSPFGANILESIKFGPSIFPIVFAALVGRLKRACAQWKAESGTELGPLEQLNGSQNISSAIQRMVVLQRFGSIDFVIVLVWFFSPLGGQSSLRVLGIDTSIVSSQGQIRFLNTKNGTMGVFSTEVTYLSAEVQAVFQASLLASEQIKKGPADTWNNIKIPMVDEMSPFVEETPGNLSITINTADQDLEYVSLTDLITEGISTGFPYDFSIETNVYADELFSDRQRRRQPGRQWAERFETIS